MVALASLLLVPSSLIQTPFTPVPPQEGEHETVVSARKLEEPLASVPQSATVVERAELEQAGLATVRDAAARVPNLFFSEFTSRRLSFPFLRGVGSGINDPAVITYVDDVPQFGFGGTNLPLLDVERVEFLRGPQGTLYGRNALGGLIHVRGARPTKERVYGAGASFGSYDLAEFSAGYSGPVGAGLLADVGLMTSQRDGFSKNDVTGNSVDDRDGSFGRGQQGRWFVRGDYRDVGDFFYDTGNLRGDSFSLVNFRAGLAGRHLGRTVWVRNAFDEEYIPIAFQPSPVDPNTFVGESGAPRVLGFTLSVHL